MSAIAVVGTHPAADGFRLVGAVVIPADTDDEIREAISDLSSDVEVVLLTPQAAEAAADLLGKRKGELVWTTMPL